MPQKSLMPFFCINFILLLILSTIIVKIPDVYSTIAIVTCSEECSLKINIPSTKMDMLNQNLYISYKNKEYKVKEFQIDDLVIENNIPIAKVILESDLKISKSNFINIKLLYNKQRIIKKIIEKIK